MAKPCSDRPVGRWRFAITLDGMTPPSVNHYVKHTRSGRHYVGVEAQAFKQTLALMVRDSVHEYRRTAEEYEISIAIFLGGGQKGDIDNFPKVVLDGLVEAGVIHSDAAVTKLTVSKGRDRLRPRTTIEVVGVTGGKF